MADQVTLSVRSELKKVIDELGGVKDAAQKVSDTLSKSTNKASGDLNKQIKKTENFFSQLSTLGRRTADQLKGDFKSLFGLNALGGALKLSNQFKGTISETVSLSDKIRKLADTFGIARSEFTAYQSALTKGLGAIGLSSDSATNALEGLSTTPVRGLKNITEYAKLAGMLASFGGEKGQEAGIANKLSGVLVARGQNPNDIGQAMQLADAIKRVRVATGKGPTEVLSAMEDIFGGMAKDMRKKIGPQGLGKLAALAVAGGPNSVKFLEDFLKEGSISRQVMEQQGFENIFTDKGLDFDKFQKASASVLSRIKQDPRLAASTLGLKSDEAAEGFVRLNEVLSRSKEFTDKYDDANKSLIDSTRGAMGLVDSFAASLNKLKALGTGLLSPLTQGTTDVLNGASQSTAGSLAVAIGGGVLAALLTGIGLKTLGKGLAGGAVGGAIASQAGATPVWVVNASQIGNSDTEIPGWLQKHLPEISATGAVAAGISGAAIFGGIAATTGAAIGGGYLGNQIDKTDAGGKAFDKLADAMLFLGDKLLGLTPEKFTNKPKTGGREFGNVKPPSTGMTYGPTF